MAAGVPVLASVMLVRVDHRLMLRLQRGENPAANDGVVAVAWTEAAAAELARLANLGLEAAESGAGEPSRPHDWGLLAESTFE